MATDTSHHPRTLIVVPTYNEAQTILPTIDALLHHTSTLRSDVLVVDDGSPDGTGALVSAHAQYGGSVFLLSRPGKLGLGDAYRAGFAWALGHGYAVIVQMDADGSHPAHRIPAMVAELALCDLVIGSRYVPGGETSGWNWRRRVLSRGANGYVRRTLRLSQTDATSGFRAWRSSAIQRSRIEFSRSEGFSFQIESTWRADRAGLRVRELPIAFVERSSGKSKMSWEIAAEAFRRVLVWRFSELAGSWRTRGRDGATIGWVPPRPLGRSGR
jgi:dolichol-phosphate mannosyltransferase